MNIFDSTPRKVKCVANYDTPIYSIHKDELEIGKLYTVKEVEVDSWCTAVYLEEFPYERGYAFNSVYFEELEGEEKEDTNLYNNTCPYYDTEIGCCRKSEVPKIENRWIPVTERLPEIDEECLVTIKGNYKPYMSIDQYFAYGWDDYGDDVVAWMPLPEPWKGDEE